MSVPSNLVTAATAAVEEIQKWRCTKMNNGELIHDDEHERDSDSLSSGFVSPQQTPPTSTSDEGWSRYNNNCLSENNPEQKTPQKNISTKLSAQQQHPSRIYRTYFVRLAEESPKRNNCDELSDSSTYDSLNCRETDICRDSSDTESNSSFSSGEIGATIKVVEYEVASASNSEDLFTNDSSSGTDDFILAAVARAICNTSKCSSDFADTEEDSSDTDSTYDSEFSLADYWVCVKCKNKQNNPMFRYCEKCYQIRKTHFPPRPRLRKSRTTIKEQKNSRIRSSLRRSATTSEVLESLNKKRKLDDTAPPTSTSSPSSSMPIVSSNISTGRLAAKRSHDQFGDDNSSSDDDDNNASHLSKKIVRISSNTTHSDEETPCSAFCINKCDDKLPAQHLRTAAKRKLPKAPMKYKNLPKRKCIEQKAMHFSSSGSDNETDIVISQPISIVSSQGTQKDSGFSSAPSSQERKSSSDHPNEDEDDDCISNCGKNDESSDTVCDELSESDVPEISLSEKNNCIPSTLEFDINSQDNSVGRHASDISLQTTTTESHAIANLVQSVSECSDAYTNMQTSSSNPELPEFSTINEKIRSQNTVLNGRPTENGSCENPSYGSCMTCLTEPKNGVFVHSRFLHLCCCYKCAVKIWNKNKKCPICNCAVKNVMKLFVH